MANKHDRPIIPDSAWELYIETGKIDDDFFKLIAHRIKFGVTLTDREQAIYTSFAKEVETILKGL